MERLDVRLDAEHRRRLSEIAATRGVSMSEAIRALIDQAYIQSGQDERRRAARRLIEMSIDDVPAPDVLKLHLSNAYDLPDLY